MTITFTFPNNREIFEVVEGVQSIKRILLMEGDSFTLWRNRFKVEQRSNGKYIYAKCKQCNASLRYRWREQEENYRLVYFNNQHSHQSADSVNDDLEKFIQDLPLSIELATARKIATSKFRISSSKFYHTYQKLKRTTSTITDLIKELQRRDYDISLDPFPVPEGEIPRIVIAISPRMKENFKLYGQTVCYDLTYNLIQDISPQKRQYAVGVFTGVNCYNKIIPFGLSITCEETTQAFCKIFESFIESCGSPKTFITDEQPSIGAALDRLKHYQNFLGTHLIDSFHVLRNFGKMAQRKDLLKQVSNIIKQINPYNFEFKIEELKKNLITEEQLKAFRLFSAKISQVCFSQIPRQSFLIFNSSNSINEKMNDLIKTRIRSQKHYAQVLRTLIQFSEQLFQISESSIQLFDFRIQDIFDDPELRLCRYLLAKRPMQQLLHQYVASLSLKQPSDFRGMFAFQERHATFQCQHTDKFDCSCDYTAKTGIGCRHMIWLCRFFKMSYIETVHPRWRFEKKPKIVINRRCNRSTRRRK